VLQGPRLLPPLPFNPAARWRRTALEGTQSLLVRHGVRIICSALSRGIVCMNRSPPHSIASTGRHGHDSTSALCWAQKSARQRRQPPVRSLIKAIGSAYRHHRGLTPHSRRGPTASRQARLRVGYIIPPPGLAPYRWSRLNSNVRPQVLSTTRLPRSNLKTDVVRLDSHQITHSTARPRAERTNTT